METLYYKLVAFIPNTKDVWDFCLGGLKACIVMNRIPTIPTLKEKKALVDFINQNNANESVFLMDNILSERIAYKRSVSEGMGVMEYNDNKAKNEWSQFYDELSGYLGIKK